MIIIETPAPPTRERLVLVPVEAVSRTASEPTLNVHTSAARDATPDDLARGGWVLDERRGITAELHATIDAFRRGIETRQEAVLRLADSHAEAIARAEKAEREREEASAVEVLRELVAWSAAPALHASDVLRIAESARRVLASAGPDPSEVVRAAMAYWESGGSMSDGPLLEAVDAYRKAGGK